MTSHLYFIIYFFIFPKHFICYSPHHQHHNQQVYMKKRIQLVTDTSK